jgi:hypothetical protein
VATRVIALSFACIAVVTLPGSSQVLALAAVDTLEITASGR